MTQHQAVDDGVSEAMIEQLAEACAAKVVEWFNAPPEDGAELDLTETIRANLDPVLADMRSQIEQRLSSEQDCHYTERNHEVEGAYEECLQIIDAALSRSERKLVMPSRESLRRKIEADPDMETEAGACPHAYPHRFCETCIVSPCPIGLGSRSERKDGE